MQTVIKVNTQQLKKMKVHYQDYLHFPFPAYAVFLAKKSDVTITAYQSGKVMFQGMNSEVEAAKWQTHPLSSTNQRKPNNNKLPVGFNHWSVLGSDEVGAGAYFGPLTTAAVYVSRENLDWVRSLGIADSKTLTDKLMQQIAPEIIARLPHHIINLMPDKYNQLQQKYNVVALKALSHNFALGKVLAKIAPEEPQAILIDQFVQANTYFHYLHRAQQTPVIEKNVYFSTKGEQQHLSVAAASVLARVIEIESMAKLSREARLVLPIGAGKSADEAAAKLLRQHKDLSHFAKMHFANTEKARKLLK